MPEAADVAWDLEPLVYGEGEAGALRLLSEAAELADTFAATYAGEVAELDGPGLAAAVAAMEELSDRIGRAGNYAMLRFSTDTSDPANGALLQKVQEQGAQIETKLLFFDLEWAALDDARADELLAAPGVEKARHHLQGRAALPPAPPHRARGEDPHREGRHRVERVGAAVRRAGLRADRAPARRGRARGARRRALPPHVPRRRGPPHDRRGRDGDARARPADPRVHLQHAHGRQGHGRPAARLPVAGSPAATSPTRRATSRCRRCSRPSATATRSRGAGTR